MKSYTDEEIANILALSPRHVHNTAKRGFNKLIDNIMKENKSLSIMELLIIIMEEFEIDETEAKKMLNSKNRAKLSVELADEFKLVERGIITKKQYQKYLSEMKGVGDEE